MPWLVPACAAIAALRGERLTIHVFDETEGVDARHKLALGPAEGATPGERA
jgi:hypothetical protein